MIAFLVFAFKSNYFYRFILQRKIDCKPYFLFYFIKFIQNNKSSILFEKKQKTGGTLKNMQTYLPTPLIIMKFK